MADEYKPGQEVPASGIYNVTHDPRHAEAHQVTCIKGRIFPPCKGCGQHPRFTLFRAAHHIENHEYFKTW
jgi:hypothetical protein